MDKEKGPWDLSLEVVDILRRPHCGWDYEVGFKTVWDGRHFPEGMCPFAWNAFSPWVWALRYGGSNKPLGYEDEDETTFVCPDPRHMIVWRISRIKNGEAPHITEEPMAKSRETIWKLQIEVDELPKGPGCERGYQVGDSWVYDGDIPEGLCPLAWNTLKLWVWALRYGGSPRPMGWPDGEVKYNCPIFDHPVVFHVYRVEESNRLNGGS